VSKLERRFVNRFRRASREEVIDFLKENFPPHWLKDYYTEYRFIMNHFEQHGVIPTDETIKWEFPDFAFGKCKETLPSLRQQLEDRESQNTIAKFVQQAQGSLQGHDYETAKKTMIELASKLNTEFSKSETIDWASTGKARADEYLDGWTPGVLSNWPTLDDAMGGFEPGQLIGLTARPNVGKSWVLAHLAFQSWLQGKAPLIVTKEMAAKEFERRLDALRFQVDDKKIRKRQLDEATKTNYVVGLNRLTSQVPLFITDVETEDPQGVSAIRAEIEELRPQIVFVDGVYLLWDDRGGKSKTERLYNIVQDLKRTARRMSVPIVITAQIGRSGRTKRDRRSGQLEGGTLDDVQWGDTFGQDCDALMILIGEKGSPERLLVLEKQRSGPPTDFMIRFMPTQADFSEFSGFRSLNQYAGRVNDERDNEEIDVPRENL
jgi:replicative DNA helicase